MREIRLARKVWYLVSGLEDLMKLYIAKTGLEKYGMLFFKGKWTQKWSHLIEAILKLFSVESEQRN